MGTILLYFSKFSKRSDSEEFTKYVKIREETIANKIERILNQCHIFTGIFTST